MFDCISSFLSRVSILLLTSDIDIVILSVCPFVRLSVCLSVRDTLVLYENGLTYRHFYGHQTSSRNSDGVTPCGGAKYRWGIKIA